jgi:hypothetical protein
MSLHDKGCGVDSGVRSDDLVETEMTPHGFYDGGAFRRAVGGDRVGERIANGMRGGESGDAHDRSRHHGHALQ